MHRRRALAALSGLALAGCGRGCDHVPRREAPPPAGPDWRDLVFPSSSPAPDGQRALLLAPGGGKGLPLLVALHGRGESGRGLDVGAHGWRDDYLVERAHHRLGAPPLTPADLEGFSEPARLARINASLAAHRYEGLCVACPYTPDLPDRTPGGAADFAAFVVDQLVVRARADAGCLATRAATGIDGVSMGGRLALWLGLTRPDVFGAVGALQPAIRVDEAERIAAMAKQAAAKAPLALRLVSSDGDPFLPAVRALSQALGAAGVAHELVETPGPHDYAWNRGPGSVEMLLWHERILRGLPAP